MTLRFSIVVPTHRRPAALARCLGALQSLDHPKDRYEVIVVRDGGDDEDKADEGDDEPRRRPLSRGPRIVWLAQAHAGPAAARNHGASRASFEHLAFTDDDCEPRPDWLTRLAARLAKAPGAVVGGRTVNALGDNSCSAASQLVVDHLVEHGRRRGTPFLPSSNLAMTRDTFAAVAGFDPAFALAGGEDRDFCHRCDDAGIPLVYAPEAVIDHRHGLSLLEFLGQHFRYGRGALRYRLARARGSGGMRFENVRFYLDLLRTPWSARSGADVRRRVAVAALLLVSQGATAAGVLREHLRGGSAPSEGHVVPLPTRAASADVDAPAGRRSASGSRG